MKKYKVTNVMGSTTRDNVDEYVPMHREIFKEMIACNFLKYCIYGYTYEIIEEEEEKPIKTIEKVLAAKEKIEEASNALIKAQDEYKDAVAEFLVDKNINTNFNQPKDFVHGNMIIQVQRDVMTKGYLHALKFIECEQA